MVNVGTAIGLSFSGFASAGHRRDPVPLPPRRMAEPNTGSTAQDFSLAAVRPRVNLPRR